MKYGRHYALLALLLMTAAVAACGRGAGTSTLPAAHNPSGLARSAAAVAPTSAPSPTLYVSGYDRVVAFPLGASGAATPSRTLFVHRLQQVGIVGIATNADTTLDVLQNFRNSPTGAGTPTAAGNFPDCRVVVYAANASGDSAALSQYLCFRGSVGVGQTVGGVRGVAIARGVASLGAVDYLEAAFPVPTPSPTPVPTAPPTGPPVILAQPQGGAPPAGSASPQPGDLVQRSDVNGSDNGLLVVSAPQAKIHFGMAEASDGYIFVSSSPSTVNNNTTLPAFARRAPSAIGSNPCASGASGTIATIDAYAPGSVGFASFAEFSISGRVSAGALAVYPVPDPYRRVYIATCDTNGYSWVDEVVTQNFPLNTVPPNRSIGPFTAASVTALAVDAQGNVYVGLTDNPGQFLRPATSSTGNAVRVYGPNFANGAKLPLRSIENPLPPPDTGNQKLTGLAITQ